MFFGHNRTAFHKDATHGSAGVGVLVKESILETFDICIIDSEIEGIMWLKFKSKLSELSLLLAVCYLPPAESCRALDSELYFQNLLKQVYNYQKLGRFLICGDLNSRIGQNSDFVEGVDVVRPRTIVDFYENRQGDKFIEFLYDVNFATLNGRFTDSNFTYITPSGRSVVDYMCVPYEEMESIQTFKIVSISDLINEINYVPDKIHNHALLLCDITLDHDQILNSITNNKDVNRERFKLSNVPNDFLTGPEIARKVNETIERIKNSLRVSENVHSLWFMTK